MKTAELNRSHIGKKAVFPVRNGGEVVGTIGRVRHAKQGTYLELDEHEGVYQTDDEREIRKAD